MAVSTARRVARFTYLGLIGLFLFGILLQAYSAGRYIWGLDTEIDLHAALGWPLAHMLAPIVLLLSFFLKGGKNFWIPSIVWGVAAILQPILAVWSDGVSEVEALHPVNALILFGLTMWLSWRAWEMASEPAGAAPAVTMTQRPAAKPAAPKPAVSNGVSRTQQPPMQR